MNIQVVIPIGREREMFLPPANRSALEKLGKVEWNPFERHYTQAELAQRLPDSDAVVTGWGCPRIAGALLSSARPRILAHTGGTIAPFVDADTFQMGMRVVCANELFAKSVAEGTIAYFLAGLRRIPYWSRQASEGNWRGQDFENYGLFGKRVGLTGYGAITRHLIPLLHAFEVEILLCSDHISNDERARLGVHKATLDEIFSTCDIVSLHNSLTDRTRHMIDSRLLGMLRPRTLLVNTARGAVIDEAALERELATGRFYAVLDVFETEPLPAESALLGLENAILMPHMAGPTSDLYAQCGAAVIEEIGRFFKGEPLRYEVSADRAQYMTAKG